MPYIDDEYVTDDEYSDYLGDLSDEFDQSQDEFDRETSDGGDDGGDGRREERRQEHGDVTDLSPEQHLAYQVWMLDNPGDAGRSSEALGFDTRQAREQAPGDAGAPGALVRQYYGETQRGEAPRDPGDLAAALIIDRDRGSWEQQLRQEADAAGVEYDPSDLEGVVRNFSYGVNRGRDPQEMIDTQIGVYRTRGQSGGDRDEGGYSTRWADEDPRRSTWGGPPPPGYTGAGWVPPPTAPPPPPGQPAGAVNPYQARAGAGGPGAAGATQAGGPRSLMGAWTGTAPTSPTIAPYPAWTPYEAPTPYTPPTPYVPGTYEAPTYTPAQPFVPPTAAQAAAEPGYQFALQQGQQALERSGAARGVTNTGGTLKNILDYGQQAATQQYGNVYNRMAGTYGMNEAARQAAFGLNAPAQFQGWAATEAGRLGAYQMTEADRAGAYAQNEANRRAAAQFNVAGGQQAWQGEAGRQQQDYANRYRQWTDQYNQWRQQGQDRFNEQWLLANA